ncbi:DUF4157 domain-containing protein [Streptomyces sp. MMG1522]|uniref:eCIS core domain-containing protein n=1 Tax=Streptomyces sp. MMG1522 TaxID=1415545 RepID=UPI00099C5794
MPFPATAERSLTEHESLNESTSTGRAPTRKSASPQQEQPAGLMAQQAMVGNAAVVQMLRQAGHHRAQPRPERHQHGPDCSHPTPQAETTDAAPVQRSAVHDVLRTPGRTMDDTTRTDMEARLGADFSDVRIHDNSAAKASAAEVGARAYTSGNHVVIGEGGGDKHTLAHELTHVIQQRQGPVAGTDNGSGLKVSNPADRFEREAEANAVRAMAHTPAVQRADAHGSGAPRTGETSIQRAPGPAAEKNRPWITHQNPNDDWEADDSAPARTDGLVLSGHGEWRAVQGYFRTPAGTKVHFYTQHGMVVPDNLGGEVEQGTEQRGNVEQGQHPGASRTVPGGRSVQNYEISYPSGLRIKGDPVIATPAGGGYDVEFHPETPAAVTINVASLTDPRLAGHSVVFTRTMLLSDILEPNMGDVHFAACRFVETGRPGTRNQGDNVNPGGLFNP